MSDPNEKIQELHKLIDELSSDIVQYREERDFYRSQVVDLKSNVSAAQYSWQREMRQRRQAVEDFRTLKKALELIQTLDDVTARSTAKAALLAVNLHPPVGDLD